jgi:hypothetical protein
LGAECLRGDVIDGERGDLFALEDTARWDASLSSAKRDMSRRDTDYGGTRYDDDVRGAFIPIIRRDDEHRPALVEPRPVQMSSPKKRPWCQWSGLVVDAEPTRRSGRSFADGALLGPLCFGQGLVVGDGLFAQTRLGVDS